MREEHLPAASADILSIGSDRQSTVPKTTETLFLIASGPASYIMGSRRPAWKSNPARPERYLLPGVLSNLWYRCSATNQPIPDAFYHTRADVGSEPL